MTLAICVPATGVLATDVLATDALATAVLAIESDKVQAGWIALAFVVALGVAVFLLFRSMNKQLKKIDFDKRDAAAPPDEENGASPTQTGS